MGDFPPRPNESRLTVKAYNRRDDELAWHARPSMRDIAEACDEDAIVAHRKLAVREHEEWRRIQKAMSKAGFPEEARRAKKWVRIWVSREKACTTLLTEPDWYYWPVDLAPAFEFIFDWLFLRDTALKAENANDEL